MFTFTLSNYFGSPGGNWLHINVVINWQLSKQGIRWPVSLDRIAGSGVDPSRSSIFWSYPLTSYWFSNDRRLKFIFFKFLWHMLCLCHDGPALLRFWFQINHGRENSASYLKIQAGRPFLTQFTRCHALRPIFMLWLVKIWQMSICGKFMQHLETCLLWQLKLTEFCVNLWCF